MRLIASGAYAEKPRLRVVKDDAEKGSRFPSLHALYVAFCRNHRTRGECPCSRRVLLLRLLPSRSPCPVLPRSSPKRRPTSPRPVRPARTSSGYRRRTLSSTGCWRQSRPPRTISSTTWASGDGKIPIAAAKEYGAKAVGIEFNPEMAEFARRNVKRAGVENLVEHHYRRHLRRGLLQGDRGDDVPVADAQRQAAADHSQDEAGNARDFAPVRHGRLGAGPASEDRSRGMRMCGSFPATVGGEWALKDDRGRSRERSASCNATSASEAR